MPRAAFSQIVNRSMSEVLTRSLATSFCTLLPILALLLFGGDTLQGLRLRAARRHGRRAPTRRSSSPRRCSRTGRSASPCGARRRQRDRRRRSARCPPTRREPAGRPSTSAPKEKRRAARRLTAPDEPERAVSAAEFDEMVERHRHEAETPAPRQRRRRATAVEDAAPPPTSPSAARAPTTRPTRCRSDGRDARAEERKQRPKRRRATASTGGPLMAHARLGDDGPRHLALHDLPARPLLGRDRRRVPRRDHRRVRLRPASSTASRSRAATTRTC